LVESESVRDIQFNLRPVYGKEDLERLRLYKGRYNIDGKAYVPGVIGLNNLSGTDYANAVFQVLNGIEPLREFFLLAGAFEDAFLDKFGLFVKKLWNWQQFKGCISPH
jgi:hypothetical protein